VFYRETDRYIPNGPPNVYPPSDEILDLEDYIDPDTKHVRYFQPSSTVGFQPMQ
jgi:hypothetical protein